MQPRKREIGQVILLPPHSAALSLDKGLIRSRIRQNAGAAPRILANAATPKIKA
jgi:hypothetical protein